VAPSQPATDYRRRPAVDVPPRTTETPPAPTAPLLALAAEEVAPERVEQPAEVAVDDLTLRSPDSSAPSAPSEEPVEAISLAAATPVMAAEPPIRDEPPTRVDAPARIEHPVNLVPPESLNPARSAVWPLTLALVVGVALGFAGGYGLGQSERQREQTRAAGSTAETEVRLRADSTTGTARDVPPAAAGTSTAVPSAASPAPAPEASRPAASAAEPLASTAKPIAPPSAADAPRLNTAVASTGRITVRTTPPGARVTIDGRAVGQAPVTIPNLGRGTHTVRVTREGYASVERRVAITPNEPTSTLTLSLTKAAAPPARSAQEQSTPLTADVLFESRPSGATVFMDGKRIGTTPMAIPSVRVGSHAFRLELAGHKTWSASLPVVAGQKNRVAASLEQQ
jgi:hypothetical protein